MNVLILGGTVFLGRHLVEAARVRGHAVTLFNRGQSNPALFPEIETVHGDRNTGFDALSGRRWDAVIDVAAYFPRQVRLAVTSIHADHYTLISTISVFADFSRIGIDEDYPVGKLEDASSEPADGSAYGPLKALCEQVAVEAKGAASLVIRPGLIVGPFDPTDRFTYWPTRVAQGGELLAPEGPDVPVQVIDARDLAEWTVRMVEARATGTYNATGPSSPLTLGDVLVSCRTVSGSDATITYASEAFLREHHVTPWSQMPLWVGNDPIMAGFARIDVRKAVAVGLTFRPIQATIGDTLRWAATRPTGPLKSGVTREREAELLAAWRRTHHEPKEQ